MSLRLRLKYQFRSLRELWGVVRLPRFLSVLPVRVGLLVMVVLMGGLYIFEVSALTTSGYEVRNLERAIANLETETRELNTELAAAESLVNVEARLPELKMVAASGILHLKGVGGGAVAQR